MPMWLWNAPALTSFRRSTSYDSPNSPPNRKTADDRPIQNNIFETNTSPRLVVIWQTLNISRYFLDFNSISHEWERSCKGLPIKRTHMKGQIRLWIYDINSFTANVADRRRHSRLPTSPTGDLNLLPLPYSNSFISRHYVVFKVFLTLILQMQDIYLT